MPFVSSAFKVDFGSGIGHCLCPRCCPLLKSLSITVSLQVQQLMERMDMDHDGNVGGDEFLATLIDWGTVMQGKNWSSYVEHAFNRMDLDGDGYIDLDELLSELPSVYYGADR